MEMEKLNFFSTTKELKSAEPFCKTEKNHHFLSQPNKTNNGPEHEMR